MIIDFLKYIWTLIKKNLINYLQMLTFEDDNWLYFNIYWLFLLAKKEYRIKTFEARQSK